MRFNHTRLNVLCIFNINNQELAGRFIGICILNTLFSYLFNNNHMLSTIYMTNSVLLIRSNEEGSSTASFLDISIFGIKSYLFYQQSFSSVIQSDGKEKWKCGEGDLSLMQFLNRHLLRFVLVTSSISQFLVPLAHWNTVYCLWCFDRKVPLNSQTCILMDVMKTTTINWIKSCWFSSHNWSVMILFLLPKCSLEELCNTLTYW